MGEDECFGALLRGFREAVGLAQQELAERSGLSTKGISALERGEQQRPYPHTLRTVASALDLSDQDRAVLFRSARRGGTLAFGERIVIPAAAEVDGPDGPWQLFAISSDPHTVNDTLDATSPLVLLHSAGRRLTGPVTEDVLLLRDEMANLAWAVERITRDGSGLLVDRFARYQRLRPTAADSTATGRYKLGSTVPDYWYPLEAARDAAGRPVLALSTLPGAETEVSDAGVLGSILGHRTGATVRDEEVPVEGTLLTRR